MREWLTRLRRQAGLVCMLAAAMGASHFALAAAFAIAPVTITLAPGSPTALLTVRNLGQDGVRIEVSVFRWQQKPNGDTVLTPTEDIVFFPEMLSLAPGESRNVRVGSVVAPGAAEKTYRLIFQQLPNFKKRTQSFEVQVLVRQSLPIFLEASLDPVTNGRIEGGRVSHGTLSFSVVNPGTRHFIVRVVRVTGFNSAGQQVFSRSTHGWYILAGGRRDYQLPLKGPDCLKSSRLRVEVETGKQTLEGNFQSPAGACQAATHLDPLAEPP